MLVKLLLRNAFRHRLRTFLTIFGVAVAILAFGLLRTVNDAWHAGVEASSQTRLITRNAISLTFSLPLAYQARIRQVDNVVVATPGNWFGGYYQDQKNFFANFAVEPEGFLQVFPELLIDPAQRQAFMRDRKSALVGRKLMQKFGWKVGDTVTLIGTIHPGNWDFTIAAQYVGARRSVDETSFFFHWDYLNEQVRKTQPRRADQVGIFWVGIRNPALAAQTSREIDAQFRNSLAETLTETERAFQMGFVAMSQTIITAIQLVSYVVIIIILAVVANTMAMSVRERTREYATLKTLGFGPGFLVALIAGESLLITGLGGGLGIALTFPAAQAFGVQVGQFFPNFDVSAKTLALQGFFTLAVGLAAAAMPAVGAARARIATSLNRID